jgi:hypothetical protein
MGIIEDIIRKATSDLKFFICVLDFKVEVIETAKR